jgi:hypothetical protein
LAEETGNLLDLIRWNHDSGLFLIWVLIKETNGWMKISMLSMTRLSGIQRSLFAPLPIQQENEFWVGSTEKMGTPGGVVLGQHYDLMEGLFQLRKRRGALLSVRNIAAWKNDEVVPTSATLKATEKICAQLIEWEDADECFLFPSGMNAVVTAMELARRRCQSKATQTLCSHRVTLYGYLLPVNV